MTASFTTPRDTTLASQGYGDREYEIDWRGGFLALKMRGVLPPGLISEPVRIDGIVHELVANDFNTLNLTRVRPTIDSPYSIPSK